MKLNLRQKGISNYFFITLSVLMIIMTGCSVPTNSGSSSSSENKEVEIGIKGVWKVTWTDLSGGIIASDIYMKYSNSKEYAYDSESNYNNNLYIEDCDIISYDNTSNTFVKHFLIHPDSSLVDKYQKAIWLIDGENIHITTYTPNDTFSGASNDQTIYDYANGIRISN